MLDIDFALLILRVFVGLLFMGHGLQKLFGWFGGGGLDGTAGFFEKLDVHPPKLWAGAAGLGETLGGLGLLLGLLTPVAAAAIIGVMFMAIVKVHWSHGLWISDNGMEYALVNLVVAAVLGLVGPGAYALDTALNLTYPMPFTFVVAVVIMLLGVLAALYSGSMVSDTEPRAETQS